MDIAPLQELGLSENEIKIYLALLQSETLSAYELGQKTGIYRVNVYDKLEQLMEKGLVTHLYEGAKKRFQATNPEKIMDYIGEKETTLNRQKERLKAVLPKLKEMVIHPQTDTRVEVFKGKEGLKYFLKDIIKTGKEVLVTGIDDQKYEDAIQTYMKQYFRDLKLKNIKERVITAKKKGVFQFDKKTAPTTAYRYLEQKQFNSANTFVYGNKVVIVSWGNPVTATMIENSVLAETYKSHFEYLWAAASTNAE